MVVTNLLDKDILLIPMSKSVTKMVKITFHILNICAKYLSHMKTCMSLWLKNSVLKKPSLVFLSNSLRV